MVADALVYHPSVAHYLRFVATTVGRDKLMRALQYFARFYAWYLLRTNGTPAQMAPWEAAKRQLGLVRKVLRAGKTVEHLKAAAVAADAKAMDPVLQYAAVGRQLAYAAYLALDTLALPDLLGTVRVRADPLVVKARADRAARAWSVGIVFSLVAQLYTLLRLRQREASLDHKDGEGLVESKRIKIERSASRLQLLSDLCDLTIPTTTLGWANFDDGFVGLAGTTSSLIGIYSQWKKTA